jgi:hypothetical protein
MTYTFEVGSGAMICMPNLIKIGSDTQKLMRPGEYRPTESMAISYAYFYFLKVK